MINEDHQVHPRRAPRANRGRWRRSALLTPLLAAYATDREAGESFGDFVVRTGVVKATVAGLDFHA